MPVELADVVVGVVALYVELANVVAGAVAYTTLVAELLQTIEVNANSFQTSVAA